MAMEIVTLMLRGVTISYCARKKVRFRKRKWHCTENWSPSIRTAIEPCMYWPTSEWDRNFEIWFARNTGIKTKGAMIRVTAESYFNFEKPTKYFYSQTQRYVTRHSIISHSVNAKTELHWILLLTATRAQRKLNRGRLI